MNGEGWIAAAVAPVVVWVLWRLQTLSVEVLRIQLVKLVRWKDQRWVYSIVSWFGVFIHEVSHASVLLLSGHGIRQFRAGVEQGHVTPARERKGPVSFLFFLVAALAPLFVPPLLFLVLLQLSGSGLGVTAVAGDSTAPTLRAAGDVLEAVLLEFPREVALRLANLDLATPWGIGLLAAAILAMPASRPSHLKGSRFHGTNDEGDVAVLRKRIRRNPTPFVAFLLFLYAAYVGLVLFGTDRTAAWYWLGFSWVWAVALCAIVLALFGAAWWTLAVLDARASALVAWIAPCAFIVVQVAARAGPAQQLWDEFWQVNAAAIVAWLAVGAALSLVLPRRRI